MMQSLELGGTGKTVALSFAVPAEVFDVIGAGADKRQAGRALNDSGCTLRPVVNVCLRRKAFLDAFRSRPLHSSPVTPARSSSPQMTDLVFFYGTLMSGFKRPGRSRIDPKLTPVGRGSIRATLFDLGIYPAAIPASDERVLGEVHRMTDVDGVLAALDEIEGYRPSQPDASLYTRVETPVTFDDGRVEPAWVYFYNAPLGRAQRIESGDYLEHLKVK